MSSQASSAGHGEKDVRQKIVETGDVDVMISIRTNFFYTRTVPCELWHFDRDKPLERKDKVLMLDARNIYRKVSRKICDFSPEQMQNLAAIVWLYRGQQDRFLGLVRSYLGRLVTETTPIPATLLPFEATLTELREHFDGLTEAAASSSLIDSESVRAFRDTVAELGEAAPLYEIDAKQLLANLQTFLDQYASSLPDGNDAQHTVRQAFDSNAEASRGLVKQVDLLHKLAGRIADLGSKLASEDVCVPASYDRRAVSKLLKTLDEGRKAAVEQIKSVVYVHRQVAWLHERFPDARLRAVPGLVKLVDLCEVEAAGWSLTPGRYVGVAPPEDDEDFDFEEVLRDIHTELADLNKESTELAAMIQENFEELGA